MLELRPCLPIGYTGIVGAMPAGGKTYEEIAHSILQTCVELCVYLGMQLCMQLIRKLSVAPASNTLSSSNFSQVDVVL